MKKILFPIFVHNKGGNILSTISICKNLNMSLFDITILIIGFKNKRNFFKKIIEKENINIKYLSFKKDLNFLNIKFLFSLIQFLKKNKYNIIHTNDGFLNLSFSIVRLFVKFNQILHIRNTDNSKRNYLSFFISNKIICISNYVYKKIPNFFNYKKVVMYNYVDEFNYDLKINNNHKQIIKKLKKKYIILFVSNIHERKKPIVFLKILRYLIRKNNSYIGIMFFNSSSEQKKVLNHFIIKNKMEKNLILMSNYPTHYWIPFMKSLKKKVLLATSKNEPLGRNLIEAVLNKIFVIANNSGGHKEIINKKYGILTKTDNINATGNKIINYFKIKSMNKNYENLDMKIFQNKFQNKNFFTKLQKIYTQTK